MNPSSTSVPMEILREAQQRWAHTPLRERLARLRHLRALIATEGETLAQASADARGRPVAESVAAEVLPLAEACRFLERNAPRLLRAQRLGLRGRPLWLGGVRSEIHRSPLGVILIIGPGNYPLLLPGVQIVQALIAGNAVVVKPGAGGSAVAVEFLGLIHRAGFDPSLVQILPESVEAAMAAIEAAPDKVIFTGNAAVAEKILSSLSTRMIPAVIEASGCDAVVIRADADIDLTVKALVFSLTLNGGATCMAPKRVFIHQDIASEVTRRLTEAVASHGIFSVQLSERHREQIAQAIDEGAKQISGGPILLENVPPGSVLWHEDVFGAFAMIASFATDEEAIQRVNDCPFALGSSIFTKDQKAGEYLACQFHVGLVTINDVIVSSADARLPFGGRRRSGYGTTRGAEGLLEMTGVKAVTSSKSRLRPAYQPSTPRDLSMLLSYLRITHGLGFRQRFQRISTTPKSS